MISVPTLLRRAEHAALSRIILSGNVLDLGGDTYGAYRSHLQGEFTVTTVNLDTAMAPDIFHDLEQPLPLEDASYDHVLMINVLEHLFEYRQLLKEAVRVVRPGGSIIVIVPFLFPIHADPHDFWRFSEETLSREFARLALSGIRIQALGTGVFAARYVMLDRLLPGPLRFINFYTLRYLVLFLDKGFDALSRMLGKKYRTEDYALGYCAVGTR